jgi:cell wall-associated NlpC family hydrolase
MSGRHAKPSKVRRNAVRTGGILAGAAATVPFFTGAASASTASHSMNVVPVHSTKTAARTGAPSYTVRKGDYLTKIAQQVCGTPADWTGIANASRLSDPDLVTPGQTLDVSCTSPALAQPAWWHSRHLAHLQHLADYRQPAPVYSAPATAESHTSAAPVQHTEAPASSGYSGGGGFQSCVISHESGGNSQVMNSTGHYGLYQFSEQTWVGHGGSAADFGHASVSEQNQVFDNAVAQDGGSDWTPYDGCAYTRAVIKGTAPRTSAILTANVESIGARVMDKALTRAGDWYSYGSAGPSTFDCSGLVSWAASQLGVSVGRDTYDMLASPHLVRTYSPQRGDLAFFGTGHVEFYSSAHETFGAQQTGTRVGYHHNSPGWGPTMFFRIVM